MMRNPVFEQSMTRRMRSYRAPLLLTLFVAFLALVSSIALIALMSPELSLANLRSGIETYIYTTVMQFALIILVAPALTAGSIAGERERQTLDLLLCTRVGALSIVLGKLFSSVCFLALLIVSSLPLLAVTMFFGGVSFLDILLMLAFLIVTALACCSIGIACSAIFKRTVTATVVAYLTIFALGVGTVILPLLFQTNRFDELVKLSATQMGTMTNVSIEQALPLMPKLLFLNPAVGLFSLLISQTGILERTIGGFLNYRGSALYTVLSTTGSVAAINIAVLVGVSLVLTGVSALFIKPSKRFGRKKG